MTVNVALDINNLSFNSYSAVCTQAVQPSQCPNLGQSSSLLK